MLKKVSAVALSASMLAVSNCAISTKATGEEKATVATATQTKEQNKIVEFCKENWVKLLAGAGITLGTFAGPIVVYYTFFRNHLQAEINDLVKLANKEAPSNADKLTKHQEALKAKAKKVLEVAEWVIIASKDNKANKEEVAKAIKALFTTDKTAGDIVKLDKVADKATAKEFLTKMGEVFGNLEKEKVKSDKKDEKVESGKTEEKEAYRVRKNRGFFMQYKDAKEVKGMFDKAVTDIGA